MNEIKKIIEDINKEYNKKQVIIYCGLDLYNKLPKWMKK